MKLKRPLGVTLKVFLGGRCLAVFFCDGFMAKSAMVHFVIVNYISFKAAQWNNGVSVPISPAVSKGMFGN